MAEIYVDMSEAVNLDPIDNGVYEAILEAEPESFEAEDSKIPCLKWTCTIADIEGQETVKGRQLFRNTPLVGKGAGFTELMLEGFQVKYAAEGEGNTRSVRFKTEDCVGKRALIEVTQRSYTDKKTNAERIVNDIKRVIPLAA